MNHLTYCKGMIDAIKSLNIWSSVEENLPMKSQFYDSDGYLCDREFVCGLTEEEWDYVGNLLVTLPNYPTPLFFFCAYPILSPAPMGGPTQANVTRRYVTDSPLVFMALGLNNFESYSSSERHFVVSDSDTIEEYDISVSSIHYVGDLVKFDDNIYRCLVDGCECKPWEDSNQWLPQFQQLVNPEKFGKKIYTAGMLAPKYLESKKVSDAPDSLFATFFYNKTKIITNFTVGPKDIVYQWRVEDVPYAKGTIVEYNGKRYKNVTDNPAGCSCIPMPYNFVPPYGCSGHWLPETFEDLPIEVQSPILPIFTNERRKINGKQADDFIISYHNDTLTFVDCVRIGITQRGMIDAHLCVNEDFPSKGDAWVSISPGIDNNIQTDVLCDYFVFGGRWAVGHNRFHFTVSRDDKYCDVDSREHYSGDDCPKSTIIFNECRANSGGSDVIVDSFVDEFSDFASCAMLNTVVDSKDGTKQVESIHDMGLYYNSDYPMRLTIATFLCPVDLSSTETNYKDKNYTKYTVDSSAHITTETNYNRLLYSDIFGLVSYSPLYVPDSSKTSQALIHCQTVLRSQLNGTNHLAPIWMYVRREPVVLDTWSVPFKSTVLFACDAVYNDYKELLIIDGKVYIVFKYLVSYNSGNKDRCGVALLVDEEE